MPGERMSRVRHWWAAIAAMVAMGCGASPITSTRIETAVATTFANLVHIQVTRLGLPAVAASDLHVTASCRTSVGGKATGSGEWVCTLLWTGPDGRKLRDTYDLAVTPDGCYTATVEGDSLGGPTLTTPNGVRVRNLLYAFEGCFDTSVSVQPSAFSTIAARMRLTAEG